MSTLVEMRIILRVVDAIQCPLEDSACGESNTGFGYSKLCCTNPRPTKGSAAVVRVWVILVDLALVCCLSKLFRALSHRNVNSYLQLW